MKIQILAVGRLKEDYFRAAEAEYRKRLRPYCHLSVSEVRSEDALCRAFPSNAILCVLDERGQSLSSTDFAKSIVGLAELQARPLVFAIGGPDGHSQKVREQAERLFSFGRATIAHRLVRLLLLEQVYRSFRILRNEPYHRE